MRFIGSAGNDRYREDGISLSDANGVDRRRHRENDTAAASCRIADSDTARESATSSATSGDVAPDVRSGGPEPVAPIVDRVGILASQRTPLEREPAAT